VKSIRLFNLEQVEGSNWTTLEIRKHRIQQIDNSITLDRSVDTFNLSILANNQVTSQTSLKLLEAKEREEARLVLRLARLEKELGDMNNPEATRTKISELEAKIRT
jgi:uncharacterized membrane protein